MAMTLNDFDRARGSGRGVPRRLAALLTFVLLGGGLAMAQNTPCGFDTSTLFFKGSPTEQARCLLRPNGIGGNLGAAPDRLPAPLESLIGKRVDVTPAALRRHLSANSIGESEVGGSLDLPLSNARLPDGSVVPALYFVIHDTSTPNLLDAEFPSNLDTNPKARVNDLSVWLRQPVAHVFVNRLGESLTATPFGETVGKGWGTKFARDFLKAEAKGLQLHIELVQPRRRDPGDANPKNDRFAPDPGFTDAQYRRLALLYLAAGVRRGSWMIPAFHSAVDAGIRDAHDDPQNFRIEKFADALRTLLKDVR